ncbi:MAG: hypothetical protein H0U92_13775 [Actinobacteria bacterium]|nr:hypothetical protein [Actinomycetota bacterium]
MGGMLRRNASRSFLAVAGVFLLLAFIAPSAGAAGGDEVPRPGVFNGTASSRAVSINLDRTALLPVNDVFNFIALDGNSVYGSSNQSARASLLFPGNGVLLGPGLACGTFSTQFPPEFKPVLDTCLQYKYPLTVFADSFAPDGASVGSLALGAETDDISGTAVSATAHAAEDSATSNAAINDLKVLGLPVFGPVALPGAEQLKLDTSLATVDNASSRTDQRIVKGVLTTTAKVSLSGIKLVGGLIKIGNLVSQSTITDDGNGARTADANLEIGGVTVAGAPAQITSKGIVLAKPENSTPLGLERLNQINKLLESLNIKFTALPSEEVTEKNGAAVANVGGVLLEFSYDVQDLPTIPSPIQDLDPNGIYTLTVQLGQTGVVGAADASVDGSEEDLTGGEEPSGFDSGSGFGTDDGSLGFGDSSDSTDLADGNGVLGGTDNGRSGSSNGTGALAAARNFTNNFGGRIGFVYLALMFAVLSLCIAPRLTVPARFPRA